jgi:DNA helicase HerA-like ATPase
VNSNKVGVIVGRGREQDHLEMVVAFSEREKAPKLGSFLVVEEQEFMKRQFLCRVEDMNYGDFQATKDERIRAIVEKYMREIAGYGRELSEEEKKTLFFRHYALKVLGQFSSDGKKIVTEYRLLPELSSVCRSPSDGEYAIIISAGIQDLSKALKIGKLVIGDERKPNDILFEPWKFERRRTAIFARTGYGKSNLCKVVVSLASLTSDVGILVLDMDGEYAFKTKDRWGKEVLGLADLDSVKPNLVVYTERKDVAEQYKDVLINPILNLEDIEPFYLVKLFEDQSLAIVSEFKYMPKNKQENWKQFIRDWRQDNNWKAQENSLDNFVTGFTSKLDQQRPLKRNLRPVLELDNPEAPNVVEDVMYHLSRGRLVVLDLSLMPLEQALLIADLVLDGIFKHNICGITAGKIINAIAVFEEAQNVLNKDAVKEGNTVFARWAKEGRKFQLGLIYVTQQPGAIAEEIVSQTDNYFVMHLLNKGDIDALKKANPHYNGVTADFLSMETFVGNTYIYSAPFQPYVFPAKVFEFNKDFFAAPSSEVKHGKSALEELQDIPKILQPVVGKYDEWRKLVGACSYEIYKYLKNNNVSAPFMDDKKQWIEYEIAEYLIKELERRSLLKLPTFSGESALGGVELDDNA